MKGQLLITLVGSLVCSFILVSSNQATDQFCPTDTCPPNSTGLYPSPTNECGYCICYDNTAQFMPCPDGTGFQPSTSQCVEDQKCTSTGTTTPQSTPMSTPYSTAYT